MALTMIDLDLYDPFKLADPIQAHRLRAEVSVMVDGMDITDRLNPHLIMVRCLTGVHFSDYQCEIELDDRDGSLPIPPVGAPLEVAYGWRNEGMETVWRGVILDIEHGFGRKQGGRRMWVHGQGADMFSRGKEPMNNSHGEGAKEGEQGPQLPVSAFLKMVAGTADQEINVHSDFDKQEMQRDYWQQAGESYYHLGQRLADDMGALFRVIKGNVGQFTIKGQNEDGTPTPQVVAVWGQNLIGWRVRPLSSRQQWKKSQQHAFDVGKGLWKQVEKAGSGKAPFDMGQAAYQAPAPAPNAGQAGGENQGADDGQSQSQGPGRIVINGEPRAQGNAFVQLIGARPGVDGVYWCEVAEHIYSRQGYITWLDVKAVQIADAAAYQKYIPLQTGLPPTVVPLPTPRPLGAT